MNEQDNIEKLKLEIEDLKSKLIDLTFEMNYNKQTELIEFLRELYQNIKDEQKLGTKSKLTKVQMLSSLKLYIEGFAKDNRISL